MAEIPIQRNEGRNIWPWIIGLIVLALLVWFFVSRNRAAGVGATAADTTMMAPATPTPSTTAAPGTAVPATGAPATAAPAGSTANPGPTTNP